MIFKSRAGSAASVKASRSKTRVTNGVAINVRRLHAVVMTSRRLVSRNDGRGWFSFRLSAVFA